MLEVRACTCSSMELFCNIISLLVLQSLFNCSKAFISPCSDEYQTCFTVSHQLKYIVSKCCTSCRVKQLWEKLSKKRFKQGLPFYISANWHILGPWIHFSFLQLFNLIRANFIMSALSNIHFRMFLLSFFYSYKWSSFEQFFKSFYQVKSSLFFFYFFFFSKEGHTFYYKTKPNNQHSSSKCCPN